MPVMVQKFERYPNVDRNAFAMAVLNYCRAYRAQDKITSARYFWVDAGNAVGVLIEGQPGCFDYDPDPEPSLLKTIFAVSDVSTRVSSEQWGDAGSGMRTWEQAGSPKGR